MEGDVKISIDYQKFEADAAWDGIKAYITNSNMSPRTIIGNYHNLWFIERAFRMNKTDLRIRPIYHRLRNRIEGHVCICFTAYTIMLELERRIKKAGLEYSVERARELTKTIYSIKYTLPETREEKMVILQMSDEQKRLVEITKKWFGCLIMKNRKREHNHKTMKGWAQKGKCTMGWFYGFKLHLVINDKGEIIQWMLTPGNVDDREPLKNRSFTERLFGKLFADRGFISQNLFEMLFVDDIHLVTKIKKNMKNSLMNLYDKIILRKRALIETVNDELKNICHIDHTRHRSVNNFVANLLAGMIAYNLLPKKPSLNIEIIDKSRLIA